MLSVLFYDFLFVFLIVMVLTGIFSFGFRRHRDKSIVAAFFILLFLTTWAAGIWIVPIGRPWGTVPWVSFLVVGIILAFLFAALIPFAASSRRKESGKPVEETKMAVATIITFDIFFWALIVCLVILIGVYYL